MWYFIRTQLKEEIVENEDRWRPILNEVDYDTYDRVSNSFDHTGVGPATHDQWMEMPASGLLIAQKFKVVVQFLSPYDQSETYFPMFDGPHSVEEHAFVSFAFVNKNHFIKIELAEGAPMPKLNPSWRKWRYEEASEWETVYDDRIQRVDVRSPQYFDLT